MVVRKIVNEIFVYYDKNPMKILKRTLPYQDQSIHALVFLPAGEVKYWSLMTHGYTSHKASILNWASRLLESSHAVVLFDLPGHYLGCYSEVVDLDHFFEKGPELFLNAFQLLKEESDSTPKQIFTIGHSLGALFSIKALNIPELSSASNISVGLGLLPEGDSHFFLSPIFKKTLDVRAQLISPALEPEKVFEKIQIEKKNINVTGKTIHLIAGKDDVVLKGETGIKNINEILIEKGNNVSMNIATKLPHHQPELAAAHINSYISHNFK